MECKLTRWRVPDKKNLFWEPWDTNYILFNELSGETHLLNEFAAEALQILETYPADEMELAERLSMVFSIEAAEVLPHMPRLLEEFDKLGLIAPDSPDCS